ncbi:PD40 domain-containing protein, partial [Candidatus Sumerlaeota bacterium]|nr:PD40 domain-containing protein [Candidatus Sumerlaeota bacterium]
MPARSLSTGSLIRLTVVAAVVVAANLSFGADDDGRKGEESVEYRLVYEEIGGGADSAVSPDGKFFSFSSRRSGNLDVWTVEIETGKLRQITSNPASDNEARWHPDGTRLVFVSLRNGSQDVYTIDLETGEEKIIADEPNNEDYPTFSKDGAEIVFSMVGYPRDVEAVHLGADGTLAAATPP